MNLTNLAIKINNWFTMFGNKFCQSSLLADGDVVQSLDATNFSAAAFASAMDAIISFILRIIYTISVFVMNIIELLQYIVNVMLGITNDISDYVVIDSRNPMVKFLTNETTLRVFKYMVGVAIILVILFTIFSIIRSEYAFASQNADGDNSKGRIFGRALRSFFIMGIFPLILILGIVLTNAIVAGFNDILKGGENTTLASQIFISGAYPANNYRNYADQNSRLPIVVNFEDPYNSRQYLGYKEEELFKVYESFQPQAKELYDKMLDKSFGTFKETVVYRNNRLYNNSNYDGYEQFVCTREQYYVMADFIDYAVKNNLRYYIKNMTDTDISWKYVEQSIFDVESETLKITYKDVSELNNGVSYTVEYTPADRDIATPIGDAIKTLSSILAIGEYADNTFNVLTRLEDAINVVEWGTDKVLIKLSDPDGYKNPLTRTTVDEMILYEWARLEKNNDLNCTIEDLVNGVELPLEKVTKSFYQISSSSYVITEEIYVVEINGTYYQVEENPNLKDDEGNFIYDSNKDNYYTVIESDFGLLNATYDAAQGKYYIVEPSVTPGVPDNKIYIEDDNVVTVSLDSDEFFVKRNSSFQDIKVEVLTGEYEIKLEDGSIAYSTYNDKVSKVIKQISWPQKLISDIQTIYKDININQMIATGKWLEQLGEYYNGAVMDAGEYGSNIATGLVHPLGLILSEFFLGEIDEADNTNIYGSLMFSSKFDDDTIRALMASLLGEEKYYQLKYELEYFNEIFNVFMGPILDEIAYYENFELMDGNEASVQLFTYKAYLASMLVSEAAGDWFYQTAKNLIYANTNYDLWTANGKGYIKYDDLDLKSPTLKDAIKNSLEASKKRLAAQYVEPGDPAYPEYLDALEEYMYDDFDDRLDIILNSTHNDEYKKRLTNNYYNSTLQNAYLELLEYCKDDKYSGVKQNIINIEEVKIGGEIVNSYDITRYRADGEVMVEAFNEYMYDDPENLTGLRDTTLKQKLEKFVDKYNTYLDYYKDYLTPDTSYKFNGQRKELEEQRDNYISQATSILNDIVIESNEAENALEKLLNNAANDTIYAFYIPFKYCQTTENWKLETTTTQAEWDRLQSHLDKYLNIMETQPNEYRAIWEDKDLAGQLGMYFNSIKQAVEKQNIIDKLNKYYITYALTSTAYDNLETKLDVVVNSKHYEVGQNFTVTKFVEYVLGADCLSGQNIANLFVPDDYQGFITTDAHGNFVSSFDELRKFLVELGDISAILYQMTNFNNVSAASKDEIVIGGLTGAEQSLAKYILEMLVINDYLTTDLMCAIFNIDINTVSIPENSTLHEAVKYEVANKPTGLIFTANSEQSRKYLNAVMSYLLVTESDESKPHFVDYSKLTLKELREICMQYLIDFEDQKGETTEQNQKRYLAILALTCSDWATEEGAEGYKHDLGAIDSAWSSDRRNKIYKLNVDGQSQATILRLCGLDNRPYEEIIDAEYSIDFDIKGIDEKNGDIFIICTYDEQLKMYIPFLMCNKSNPNQAELAQLRKDEDNETWISKYKHRNAYTKMYINEDDNDKAVYFPVIAKGTISKNGEPSAIRQVDDRIEFYREDILVRDASDVGLSTYYASMEQINVKHTALSLITNTFTQITTGKTLVEHLCETIPRFATSSDYKLLFGKNIITKVQLVDGYVGMSYVFDESQCPPMDELYDLRQFNLLTFLIALVTMTIAIWNAMWGLIKRAFEVTLYFLLGPPAIATIALKVDSKDKDGNIIEGKKDDIYDEWKKTITDRLLGVFAYAIGFNIFFLAVPVIQNMTLFESAEAFRNIPVLNNPNIDFLNEIARLIFIIAAGFLSTRAPALFAEITATANGFQEGAKMYEDVKNTVSDTVWEVGDVVSGRRLTDAYEQAKETAAGFIPLVRPIKEIIEENEEKFNKIRDKYNKIYAKVFSQAAKIAGKVLNKIYLEGAVPDEVIDAAAKQLEKEMIRGAEYRQAQRKKLKKLKKERADARHKRQDRRSGKKK